MMQLFIILLIAGWMMIGAEIFIPGGVLGTFGGFALLGAMVTAFIVFPPDIAVYITGGIILMLGVVIGLWIKYFPKTWVGKQMTVSHDLHTSKGTEDTLKELLNREGVATSALHPGGFAEIDGHRIDVITQGEMLDRETPIRVVAVESNRVIVSEIET